MIKFSGTAAPLSISLTCAAPTLNAYSYPNRQNAARYPIRRTALEYASQVNPKFILKLSRNNLGNSSKARVSLAFSPRTLKVIGATFQSRFAAMYRYSFSIVTGITPVPSKKSKACIARLR